MALFLEIKTGPMKGQTFKAKEGVCIGRVTGDIIIPDPKISSLHAEITNNKTGGLLLLDKGSSNGIWIDEHKVKTVALLPGVVFRVGRTELIVVEKAEELEVPKAPSDSTAWVGTLAKWLPGIEAQDSPMGGGISVFENPLELKFIAGPQTDESVVLGYGPRSFGNSSLDFELKDPASPFLAFEIVPRNGQAYFITNEIKLVLLNKRELREDYLKGGDIISVGTTQIRVSALRPDSR